MKILITSISNKTTLIEAVRKTVSVNGVYPIIIGADSNPTALAKDFVDEFWHMPVLKDILVKDFILYCNLKGINIIFPSRDGELKFFAKHKEVFFDHNIHVMVSPLDAIEISLDKLKFYDYLSRRKFPVIPTVLNIEYLDSSLYIVKERMGSGSQNIYVKVSKEEAIYYAKGMSNPIFQPYIEGIEYSIDLYMTKVNKPKSVIVRERVDVVDGESQITRTVRRPVLEDIIEKIAITMKLKGHVMFQAIVDGQGHTHILECNARIGGASTLSIYAGMDSFHWWIKEANGSNLDEYIFRRNEKELTLIRYKKDLIV